MGLWAVDTAMVGRLGSEALSAVGLGGQIYWTLLYACGALGTGAFALVARNVGAGDSSSSREVTATSIGLAALIGLSLTFIVRWLTRAVFRAAGIPGSVSSGALLYVDIVSWPAVFMSVSWIGNSIIRATGNTRVPLYITGAVNVFNLVADYGLIFGRLGMPALGMPGAAWASAAAQILGGLLTAGYLMYREASARLDLRRVFAWRKDLVVQLARLSVPAGLEGLLMDGARAANLLIIGSLGTVSVAAHQTTAVAESLSFMPGFGFAVASGVVAGQCLGAGRPDEARRGIRAAWAVAAVFMSLCAVLFVLIPARLIGLFTTDSDVVRTGARLLVIAALAQPFIATTEVLTGGLRGAGDTKSPLWITALGAWGVRFPVTWLAIRVWGFPVSAAWWAMVAEWAVRSVLTVVVFRRGRWERLRL